MRRDSHDHYLQELQIKGSFEVKYQEGQSLDGRILTWAILSNGTTLGFFEKDQEGFYWFKSNVSVMFEARTLFSIARKAEEMNRNRKQVEKIHEGGY